MMTKKVIMPELEIETEIMFFNPNSRTVLVGKSRYKGTDYYLLPIVSELNNKKRKHKFTAVELASTIMRHATGFDDVSESSLKLIWSRVIPFGTSVRNTLLIEMDNNFSLSKLQAEWEGDRTWYLMNETDLLNIAFPDERSVYANMLRIIDRHTHVNDEEEIAVAVANKLMTKLTRSS